MEFEVTSIMAGVDFGPENENLEILQNVRTILSTPQSSVPLDRDFGLPWAEVDGPISIVKAKLTSAIVESVEKYEPRVRVTEVTFDGEGMDGIIRPRVKVRKV